MKYGFQDASTFLNDFGVEIKFNGKKGLGILDTPDQVFIDGQIQSTIYQIVYKTEEFCLEFDKSIEVDGVIYKIKEVSKMDDGLFSRAFLAKV